MFQDLTTLVLDIGSYQSRIGYGGDQSPKIVTPSCISTTISMQQQQKQRQKAKKNKVGKKFFSLDRPDLDIQRIFTFKNQGKGQGSGQASALGSGEGMTINEKNYENFVDYLLNEELRVNVRDYSLLFSQDVNFNQGEILAQREAIAKIAFQKLGASNIFFLKTPVLSCFATGRSTALVVDSGDSQTRITAVHDGFVLNKTAKLIPFAGKTLSLQLKKLIEKKTGKPLQTRYHLSGSHYQDSFLDFHTKQLLTDIKQSFSLGSSQQGSQASQRISYQLPDRSTITVDRSELPDIFLSPSEPYQKEFPKFEYRGLPPSVADTINLCDIDIRKQLYSNLLFTGGNMLFNGQNFTSSLLSRLASIAPPNAKVKPVSLCQHGERQYLSWIGGSIVTSLSAFQGYWIGKEEFAEIGVGVLERKCT